MTYETILKEVLKFEGGYVNNPNDKGGATNFGVTQLTYDTHRLKLKQPIQSVKLISDDEVKSIYLSYWSSASCDRISKTKPLTAAVHFDCAINSGPKQANRLLQRACGAKPVDGVLGSISFNTLDLAEDSKVALEYLKLRTGFFVDLCLKDATQLVFLKGWLFRVQHLHTLIYEWSRKS